MVRRQPTAPSGLISAAGARDGWVSTAATRGAAGSAGSNPAEQLERSDLAVPVFSPVLPWEIGNTTEYFTPNVVFWCVRRARRIPPAALHACACPREPHRRPLLPTPPPPPGRPPPTGR